MASGVNGVSRKVAAQHVGPVKRCGGGVVTVPCLDQGAWTAMALHSSQKTATISLVHVGICVYRVTNILSIMFKIFLTTFWNQPKC